MNYEGVVPTSYLSWASKNYEKLSLVLFFEVSKYIKRKVVFFFNAKQDDRSYSHSFNTHT